MSELFYIGIFMERIGNLKLWELVKLEKEEEINSRDW